MRPYVTYEPGARGEMRVIEHVPEFSVQKFLADFWQRVWESAMRSYERGDWKRFP